MRRRPLPALAVAACAIAHTAAAEVAETVKHETYAVSGTSETEVRTDINAKRPGQYDALANWYIRWRYTYRQSKAACALATVDTRLELTIKTPALTTSDPALRKSFDAYLTNLRLHEEGHADIARSIARRIDTALQPMTAATCEALGREANEQAHGLIRVGNTEQADYDARTDHGATQGARWPRRVGPPPPDRSQFQTGDPR